MAETDSVSWPALKEFCKEKQGGCLLLREEQMRAQAPINRWNMAVMLGSVFALACAAFFYISANMIRDYDLTARDRYVTVTTHAADIGRIDSRMQSMETRLMAGQNEVLSEVRKLIK